MRVVSNTSPISYLVIINQINLLNQLFGEISVPGMVQAELASPKAPFAVRQWIANPPEWLIVQLTALAHSTDLDLLKIDAGERAAILLAESLNADLILLDDLDARRLAANHGLALTGVLGILDRAADRNVIDFAKTIGQLQQTNFRTSKAIVQTLLEKHSIQSISRQNIEPE
ncbi:MAG: DUF3368 domain-containing protein [Phormidesmis sp.]